MQCTFKHFRPLLASLLTFGFFWPLLDGTIKCFWHICPLLVGVSHGWCFLNTFECSRLLFGHF